jgi:hypothetical protein
MNFLIRNSIIFQASKLVDKVVDVLSTQHGAWGRHNDDDEDEESQIAFSPDLDSRVFWKLDVWEDDARRRRR